MMGCNKPEKPVGPPLSLEEAKALICGRWEGWYAKGKEYFEIRPDETFSQTFVREGVTNYVAEGKWSAEQYRDWYEVRFKPFMDLRDTISQGRSPERTTGRLATFYEDDLKINFVPDLAYFIFKKRSVEGATGRIEK